jgi:hypothetical protein
LLIPFDQKPLTSQIKEADEFDLISLIGRPHTERSSAVFDDLQSEGREIVELEKRKYRSATFSLVVNFQSPFRRHSSNPRAIQPLEDHHEQSSHDSDGHHRDKSNPDGDGDTSGNRAHAHRSFPPTKPGFKRADNNWFRTAGSNGELSADTLRSFQNGGARAMGLASCEIIGNDAEWQCAMTERPGLRWACCVGSRR